jgi:hypothetical protein
MVANLSGQKGARRERAAVSLFERRLFHHQGAILSPNDYIDQALRE